MITLVENRFIAAGQTAKAPLRRVSVVAVIENPHVDRYVADLGPMVEASLSIGQQVAREIVRAMDGMPVQSYGKAGLVGLRGEQEHANALLTTVFANPLRDAIGGSAWISSVTKLAAPGATIDIPLNCVEDVYVRSHYDTITFALGETPMPDEIALISCVASGGRLTARVGGLGYEAAKARGPARA
jgi:hypothetical protein